MLQVFINVMIVNQKRKEDNQDSFPFIKKDIFVSNNMAEKAAQY